MLKNEKFVLTLLGGLKGLNLCLWIACYYLSAWKSSGDDSAVMIPIFHIEHSINSNLNVLLSVILQFHLSFWFYLFKYYYFILICNIYTCRLCCAFCIFPQNLPEVVKWEVWSLNQENEGGIGRWIEMFMRNPNNNPITQVKGNLCGTR